MMTIRTAGISHVRVKDAVHSGIISVPPETPSRMVAKVMAERHVHAVAISSAGSGDRVLGIVRAIDVVAAAAYNSDQTAGDLAREEVPTISSNQHLDQAARLMAEHEVSHLIVTDSASGRPSGVLSTLDVLAAYGG